MKNLIKRVAASAPVWAWIVMIVCVIILIVGLVIANNRTAPTSSSAATSTPAATEPTTPATVQFMDYAKSHPSEPRTIVLLGDSSGASPTGWAPALGKAASESLQRPVATAYWNTSTKRYGPPAALGSGKNGAVGFWNGSAADANSQYAIDNLSGLIGDDVTPNLILLNFGHTQSADEPLADQIQPLIAKLKSTYPDAGIAVIKQSPSLNANNSQQLAGYASAMDAEGIQVIDVYSAFPTDPAALGALLSGDSNPNAEGQKIWTKTVLTAFGLPTS